MYHHGMQIAFGIYFMVHFRERISFKHLTSGLTVLASLIAIALVLNVVVYKYFMANGIDETFNMFFISPHCEGTLPVYSLVQGVVAYPWCMIIYVAIFTLAAYIMLLLAMLIKHRAPKNKPIPVA